MSYLNQQVGYYKSSRYRHPKTNKIVTGYTLRGSCTLEEILNNKESKYLIQKYRETGKQTLKESIILFTPVGYYPGKRVIKVEPQEKTGLVQIDVDGKSNPHINNWRSYRDHLFKTYKFIAVCAVSCGGSGLFILVNTTGWQYYQSHFYSIANLLESKEELNIDRAVSSPNELRYMTLADDILYRGDAKVYTDKADKPRSNFEGGELSGDGVLVPMPEALRGAAHREDVLEWIMANLHNGVRREHIIQYMRGVLDDFVQPGTTLSGDMETVDGLSIDLYSRYADQFGQGRKGPKIRLTNGRDLPGVKLTEQLTTVDFDKDDKPSKMWVVVLSEVLVKYRIFCNDSGIYQFIETHWQKVPRPTAGQFLKDCAIAIGISPDVASGHRFVEGLIKQLESDSYDATIKGKRDKLNFINGSLDVDTMTLHDHDPEDYLFYCLEFEYDVKAKCPKFDAYLNKVLPDRDYHKTIYSYIGCCFSGSKIEKMLCLVGDGGNGKSVLLDVLSGVLGDANVSHVNVDAIASIHPSADNYRLALENRIINVSSESKFKNIDFSVWKQLASREPVTVHNFHKNRYEIRNYARTIYAINTMPVSFDEISNGFFRRLLIVPFDITITEEEKNINLASDIINHESPGVMNKIIAAIKQFNTTSQVYESPKIKERIKIMEMEGDSVQMFISDSHYVAKEVTAKSPRLLDVYSEYRRYCEIELYVSPMGRNKFNARLERLGILCKKAGKGLDCIRRLGLLKTADKNGRPGGGRGPF